MGNSFSNFQNFGSYSYYVFNNEGMPSSYMPPLYFLFLYINKIISFDLINFLYLVFFNQILLSTISVYIFYKICNNFLTYNYSLAGALIFSIFRCWFMEMIWFHQLHYNFFYICCFLKFT